MARYSAGQKETTQQRRAIPSSSIPAHSPNSCTCSQGTRFITAPRLDHFGLQVATRSELVSHVERASDYKQKDDRVQIIDIESRTTPGPTHDYTLTSAYIGYLLPLMIEVQHLARLGSAVSCFRRLSRPDQPVPARSLVRDPGLPRTVCASARAST